MTTLAANDVRVGVLLVDDEDGGRVDLSVFYRLDDGVVIIGAAPSTDGARLLQSAARATLVVRDEMTPHVCLHVEGPLAVVRSTQATVFATLQPECWHAGQ